MQTAPRLQLLGGFALSAADGAAILLPRKARALLAYLALAGGAPVPRERLAALLWEDAGEAQARASLRQALAAIRRACASTLVETDSEHCRLATPLAVDVAAFEAAADAELRVALYAGDLLEGFAIGGQAFAGWLLAERARLRDRAIADFAEVAEAALAARRSDAAIAAAQRLVALDPLHEPGHRLLMRAYADSGRAAEALRQYRTLQAMLRQELGAAPEPETVTLARAVAERRRQAGAQEGRTPEGGFENPAPEVPFETPAPEDAPAPPEGAQPAAPFRPEPPAAEEPRRELRRMAVLSVELAGFAGLASGMEFEDLEAVLAGFRAITDEEAGRQGGRLLERHSDTSTYLFGAAVAHDDDPLRAALAADAIHRRMAAPATSLPAAAAARAPALAARAGLVAGPLLLVSEGDSLTAVGEPLALAAQLVANAEPGATLVVGSLLAELAGRFGAEPRGRIGAASAHRLTAPRSDWAPPAITGRAAELAQVEALLDSVEEGTGRTLLIRGEAGIGKSRLAEAAAEAARARGWRTVGAVVADCGEEVARTPRRQVVLALLGLSPDLPLPDRLDRHPLARGLGEDALPILYQLAGGVAPADVARRAARADPSPTARDRVFGALLRAASADRPLLILVEDMHWAGPDVLVQVQRLSAFLPAIPVLLLLTTRPEPDLFDAAWRMAAGPLSTIDLGPIGRQASRAVARGLGVEDPALVDALAARAHGNPLYLRQLVAAVAEGVALDAAVPGSVQGLTLGRMDRLDPEERLALRAAAVLGQRAALDAVQAVAGLPHWRPGAAALGPLLQFDGHTVAFAHALVRDAVASVTTPRELRALHRAAADWYRDGSPELHARHLGRAGDPAAGRAWARAAEGAMRQHRPDKALAMVEAGLRDPAHPADTVRLRLIESRARLRLLDFAGAAEAARAAGAAAQAADAAPDLQVDALIAEADAEAARQAADEALARLETAARLAEQAGLAAALARIHGLKGNIHFPRGALEACLADHGAALVWARRAGSTLAEAGALAGLAWAHYQRGAFAEACHHADACLALAEGPAFERIRLSALRVRAVSRIFLLRHADALADAETAIALAVEQGDALNEVLARTTAGTAHLECWDQDAAFAVAEPALQLAQRLGRTGLEAAPLWVIGTAHGARGDQREARRHLEQARAAGMQGTAIRFAVPRILGTLAFFADPAERLRLFDEGEAMLQERPAAHSANGLYGSALHGALVFAEHALADRCVAGLERNLVGEAGPWAEAMIAFGRLFSALSRGDPVAAQADALHARARAEAPLSWLRPTMRAVKARLAA